MSETVNMTSAILKPMLADAGAMTNRDKVSDMDACWTTGFYNVNSSQCANKPAGAYGYGVFVVFAVGTTVAAQIYLPHVGERIYFRIKWGSIGQWNYIEGSKAAAAISEIGGGDSCTTLFEALRAERRAA